MIITDASSSHLLLRPNLLAEIKIAKSLNQPIRYFKIEKYSKIIPISVEEVEMEDDIKQFRNELPKD